MQLKLLSLQLTDLWITVKGMDARNERLVFELLVNTSCRESNAQVNCPPFREKKADLVWNPILLRSVVKPKIFLSAPAPLLQIRILAPAPALAPDSFIRYLENYLF